MAAVNCALAACPEGVLGSKSPGLPGSTAPAVAVCANEEITTSAGSTWSPKAAATADWKLAGDTAPPTVAAAVTVTKTAGPMQSTARTATSRSLSNCASVWPDS